MIKVLRVFVGTAVGLFIAQYFNFLDINGILNYLWATLIVMAVVFIVRGFHF